MTQAKDLPDPQTLLATARRVIKTETDALAQLGDNLGEPFVDAVGTILSAQGRVIVSGMGKSGHVGRKIAATLASTGTPAMFVHPGEASHGDLGMITAQDVVLLLSNSGETAELSDLIAYTRRFDIPLIGFASKADSTLIRQSDVGLVLPQAPEACSVGLAPTTSTTLTMALGDALAVALMEHRKFTPEDFHAYHPGGRLGARLATVEVLMHGGAEVPLVSQDCSMSDALLVMTQKGFGVVGVADANGDLAGIITDGDLRRNMTGLLSRNAGDVMTVNPATIAPSALASEALGIMNARKITALFVTDAQTQKHPLGVLHVHDCLRAGIS